MNPCWEATRTGRAPRAGRSYRARSSSGVPATYGPKKRSAPSSVSVTPVPRSLTPTPGTIAQGAILQSGTPEGVVYRAPDTRQRILGFLKYARQPGHQCGLRRRLRPQGLRSRRPRRRRLPPARRRDCHLRRRPPPDPDHHRPRRPRRDRVADRTPVPPPPQRRRGHTRALARSADLRSDRHQRPESAPHESHRRRGFTRRRSSPSSPAGC